MRISDWSSDVCSSDLVAFAVFVELQSAREHLVDPGGVQFGELRVIRLQRITPLLVGLTQPLAFEAIKLFQPLGKSFFEDRNGEEGARNFEEGEPVIMRTAHNSSP